MKLNKLFLLSAMGMGLFACNNNDLVEGSGLNGTQEEGTTYVAFTVDFGEMGTRTTTPGTSEESKVTTVYALLTNKDGDDILNTYLMTHYTYGDAGSGNVKYMFATSPGTYDLYVVVNPDQNDLTETNKPTKISDYLKTGVTLGVASITTNDNFMMSSTEKAEVYIRDNVTEQDAKDGNDASTNNFTVSVERVVAKVTMTCENTTLTNATNNAGGTITTPKFTLKGGATRSYRMAQSAINEIAENTWNYTRSETDVYVKAGTETDLHKLATPVYCLENIHATSTYKQGNTTYLNLNTKFVPGRVVNCNASAENGELKDNPNATSSTAVSFYVVKTGSLAGNYILKSELDTFQGVDDTKFPNGVESISAEYVGGT